MFSSLVLACMTYACGFLVIICHCHGGLPILTMDLCSLSISWIDMEIVGLFLFFLVCPHISFAWVQLLFPGALVGQTLWSP